MPAPDAMLHSMDAEERYAEEKFRNVDALIAQIRRDVDEARDILRA